jgi:hypothetical protein
MNPEIVFAGNGVRTNGLQFLTALMRHTESALRHGCKIMDLKK